MIDQTRLSDIRDIALQVIEDELRKEVNSDLGDFASVVGFIVTHFFFFVEQKYGAEMVNAYRKCFVSIINRIATRLNEDDLGPMQ